MDIFDMDMEEGDLSVYEKLRKVFQEVDPEILKLISYEHNEDMDAAITAVVEDIEYYQLRVLFPLVDADILKAISIEYRNNLEAGIKIILDEIVYYMPGFRNNDPSPQLQNQNDDHDVALLVGTWSTQLFDCNFDQMGDYRTNDIFNQLVELFPQVDHRILKAVSFNHKYDLQEAIDVIVNDFVFEQLKDVFPLVNEEILKAIAGEHSDDVDVAIHEVLRDVVPYMPNYTCASDGAEIEQEEFSLEAAKTLTGNSTFHGLSEDVLGSAVECEADEMKPLEGPKTEEAKSGEGSPYFDDPASSDNETTSSSGSSDYILLEDSSVSRSLDVKEEPPLDDYISVSREMCEKLEEMAEDATHNKRLGTGQEEHPLVEFQKDEVEQGEDISEELINALKVLQQEVHEHPKMVQDFLLESSSMVVKEEESLVPEEFKEKLDRGELLRQCPALSNKRPKLAPLTSCQDTRASDKLNEKIETSSPECQSPIGGKQEGVVGDGRQELHEDDWEFIGHSDVE